MPLPIFSNYTVIRELGQGGMARVYLATHKTLGHHVAIKVLNKEFIFNQNIRSRFVNEAKKMVRMNHLNVVKVSDLIDEENTVAIVMEYVEGKTLAELCNEKKLSNEEIELYLKQMLQALSYIHTQGLIHRDIKPSNFILSKDGYLKLTDFGISKSFLIDNEHTQTSTSMSLGTPMYMSPEQVRSSKEVNHLTDIYSLGVVLWQLASGKKPYNSITTSAFDLQLKIVQEKLPLTNTRWDEVVQKATQKEDTKRFLSATEFLFAIDKKEVIAEDFEKTLYSEKKTKEVIVEQKNKKTKLLIFLLLGIFLVFGMILFFMNYQEVKNKTKKEQQIELVHQNENEKIERQKDIDSIEVIAEKRKNYSLEVIAKQRKNDSLKLVLEFKEKNKLKIGQKYQGGIIYYLDDSGKHGKVCAERDLGEFDWVSAIKRCKNLNLNGYFDWYLPTIDDLVELFLQKHILSSLSEGSYWSSSESVSNKVEVTEFGTFRCYTFEVEKELLLNVRAIRNF